MERKLKGKNVEKSKGEKEEERTDIGRGEDEGKWRVNVYLNEETRGFS